MAYLGGYTLPYEYPIKMEVRFESTNRLTSWGNYGKGYSYLNGSLIDSRTYSSKSECDDAMANVRSIAQFLSDKNWDVLSREEFNYIFESEEYDNISGFFSLSSGEFKELIETGNLKKSVETHKERGDNFRGWLTGIPNQAYYLRKIDFDERNNIITIEYHLPHQNSQKKIVKVRPYFKKCLLFAYKLNYLIDITENKDSVLYYPNNAKAYVSWNVQQKLKEFGYLIIH